MGAFNELIVDGPDGEQAIQFKFGECRQHVYRLGDRIIPDDDPLSSKGDATIDAIGGSAETGWTFYAVRLRDGVLVAHHPITERLSDLMTMLDQSWPLANDTDFMQMAITLAMENVGKTADNPSVGCVLIKAGQFIGAGATAPGGRPHAEEQALAMAGEAARGATAYVTLEPCGARSKGGRSCSELLAAAGVARVVVACEDASPYASGQGAERLTAAGIPVDLGLLAAEAAAALDYKPRERQS